MFTEALGGGTKSLGGKNGTERKRELVVARIRGSSVGKFFGEASWGRYTHIGGRGKKYNGLVGLVMTASEYCTGTFEGGGRETTCS